MNRINETIEWFKMVCKGIRDEYEKGVSHRKIERDVQTLKNLLKELKRISKEKKMTNRKERVIKYFNKKGFEVLTDINTAFDHIGEGDGEVLIFIHWGRKIVFLYVYGYDLKQLADNWFTPDEYHKIITDLQKIWEKK